MLFFGGHYEKLNLTENNDVPSINDNCKKIKDLPLCFLLLAFFQLVHLTNPFDISCLLAVLYLLLPLVLKFCEEKNQPLPLESPEKNT